MQDEYHAKIFGTPTPLDPNTQKPLKTPRWWPSQRTLLNKVIKGQHLDKGIDLMFGQGLFSICSLMTMVTISFSYSKSPPPLRSTHIMHGNLSFSLFMKTTVRSLKVYKWKSLVILKDKDWLITSNIGLFIDEPKKSCLSFTRKSTKCT